MRSDNLQLPATYNFLLVARVIMVVMVIMVAMVLVVLMVMMVMVVMVVMVALVVLVVMGRTDRQLSNTAWLLCYCTLLSFNFWFLCFANLFIGNRFCAPDVVLVQYAFSLNALKMHRTI